MLEGVSGVNDPVGIAAMAALLAAGTAGGWPAVGAGVGEFVLEMVVGVAGGMCCRWRCAGYRCPAGRCTRCGPCWVPGRSTDWLRWLTVRGLTVFVAGILVGDLRAPYKAEIERFHSSLASLAEIVAFAMLGLTVSLTGLTQGTAWLVGLALAVLLALVARPVLVGLLLLAVKISNGERLFMMWSGLKGAVPIMLGTYRGRPDPQPLFTPRHP